MNDPRKATAKRWAAANGYQGAKGGWIYDKNWRPVTQGWVAFAHKMRSRIAADVAAGSFVPSRGDTSWQAALTIRMTEVGFLDWWNTQSVAAQRDWLTRHPVDRNRATAVAHLKRA